MRNVVCIGGSSGALDALQRLLQGLPADLPASLFVVRHISADSSGLLPQILQPKCALPVAEAIDGEPIRQGRVYIAPPNRHLLLEQKNVKLASGPKENWVRPAIDPLFRTAAQFHGPRSIGIILSGKLDDGAAGLWALKRRGGFAVVQDARDAAAPEMPRYAMNAVAVDVVADAEEIGAMLPEWCAQSTGYAVRDLSNSTTETENGYLMRPGMGEKPLDEIGIAAGIVCPECGGQLWQLKEGPLRYRCHVGHGISAHSLLAQQSEVVENTGWQLVRALEEDNRIIAELLKTKLSGAEPDILAQRLKRNHERLQSFRPLVSKDQGDAPFTSRHLDIKRDDPSPIGGDSTDATPVGRT